MHPFFNHYFRYFTVYSKLCDWAKEFDKEFYDYLFNNKSLEEVFEQLDQIVEHSESAEACFERNEKQEAARNLILTACNLLYEKNPSWYYILIDSCVAGMSSAQIAKVLQTSTRNVDVMKHRARKYLQKMLGKQYQEFF